MGGSTADAFDSASRYSKAKLGKLQEHTERQTNELAKTVEANVHGSIDNTAGAAQRGIDKGMKMMGLMPQDSAGDTSDGSASANYSNKSTATSKGSGKKADLGKDKAKKTGGKASLYAKKN